MTWKTARGALLRWCWLPPLLAVVAGGGGYLAAKHQRAQWTATIVVQHTPYAERIGTSGLATVRPLQVKPAELATATYFPRLPKGFSLSPNSAAAASLSAKAPNAGAAAAGLSSYVASVRRTWSSQLAAEKASALAQIRARRTQYPPKKIANAIAKVTAIHLPPTTSGHISAVETKKALAPATTAAVGAIAGALLAVLLVLAGYALRGRVWDAAELAPLEAAVVGIDTSDQNSIHALRIELEALGIGRDKRTITVAAAGRGEGHTPVAYRLAEAFAGAGAAAVLVSADPASAGDFGAPGVGGYLAGASDSPPVRQLAERVRWMPAGTAHPGMAERVNRERVTGMIGQAELHGDVVIVEAAPVGADPTAVLLASVTDVTVLVVHRRSGRCGAIAVATTRIRRIAGREPLVCFDRVQGGPRPAAVPEAATQQTAALSPMRPPAAAQASQVTL